MPTFGLKICPLKLSGKQAKFLLSATLQLNSKVIRNKIQKYFRAWIRGLGGVDWWKNQRLKIFWHGPFKVEIIKMFILFIYVQ
jgi:hypothetical protein